MLIMGVGGTTSSSNFKHLPLGHTSFKLTNQSGHSATMAMRDEDPVVAAEKAARLQAILKRIERARRDTKQGKECEGVQPSDMSDIVSVFNTPNHNLGYIALSSIVSLLRECWSKDTPTSKRLTPDEQTKKIAALLYPELDKYMPETDPDLLIPMMWLIQIIMQIDAAVGGDIILRDGTVEWLEELSDIFEPNSLPIRYKCITLSLASGIVPCRPMIVSKFQPWLQEQARHSLDLLARSTAAVALTKLSRTIEGKKDSPEEGLWDPHGAKGTMDADRRQTFAEDEELTELMKELVVSGSTIAQEVSPAIDAVEGLAYLSDDKSLKEGLADDAIFLQHLFSLIPTTRKHNNLIAREIDDAPTTQTSTALMFGVATIICNLACYPAVVSEEHSQLAKLRRMAQPGAAGPDGKLQDPNAKGDSAEPEEVQESDETIAKRGAKLVKAGVVAVLATLSKSESTPTRNAVAGAFLALAQPREHRGLMLQQGAGKALKLLCHTATLRWQEGIPVPPLLTGDLPADIARRTIVDLLPLQALAKLAITTEPRLLFGTQDADVLDACAPFQILLLHPTSSLLQQFEALMALTNLASASAVVAEKVTSLKEIGSKLEVMMLDDNEMIRRAAVELLCNTITTEGILPRYGDAPPSPSRPSTPTSANAPTTELKKYLAQLSAPSSPALVARLHVLLGLSDVEDLPTQLAASGALATLLSISPAACKALLSIKKGPNGVFAILGDIINPRRILERELEDDDESESEGEKTSGSSSNEGTVNPPKSSTPTPSNPTYSLKHTPGELLQLAHRGVVCLWALISTVEGTPQLGISEVSILKAAKEEALTAALVALIKPLMNSDAAKNQPATRQIIMTAAQSLKWLSDKGVEVA